MAILGSGNTGDIAATAAAAKANAARAAAAKASATASKPRTSAPAPKTSAPKTSAPVASKPAAPKSVAPKNNTGVTGPISKALSANAIGPQGGRLTDTGSGFTTANIQSTFPSSGNAAVDAAYPDATADPQYQMQLAQLANSMANYEANQRLALNQYDDQLGENLNRMGWNAATKGFDPKGQGSFGQDFRNNEGDFAARGAFFSGPHITAQSDLNFGYNSQKNDMDNARARFVQGQNQAAAQMQNQNALSRQDALTQAVARIAAQQGIDFNKVPGANQISTLA